jgi:hypothetical protein
MEIQFRQTQGSSLASQTAWRNGLPPSRLAPLMSPVLPKCERPKRLAVLGILTNEESRPARLPLVVRVALEAHGGPGQVLRTPFSHFADVVV